MMVRVLKYHGNVVEFRRALRKHRMAIQAAGAGMLAGDNEGRRQFQRYLRQAEMASLRCQILGHRKTTTAARVSGRAAVNVGIAGNTHLHPTSSPSNESRRDANDPASHRPRAYLAGVVSEASRGELRRYSP